MKQRIIYLSIIIVGLLVSFGLARNLYLTYQNSQILTQAKAKLERLKAENTQLKADNEAAQDPNFIEREARNRLGLVKPGEVVVVLPEKGATLSASPQDSPTRPNRPIWQQWLGLFFGA